MHITARLSPMMSSLVSAVSYSRLFPSGDQATALRLTCVRAQGLVEWHSSVLPCPFMHRLVDW